MHFYVHISEAEKAEEAAIEESAYGYGGYGSSKRHDFFYKYVHPCKCLDQCCIGTTVHLDLTRYKRGTINGIQEFVEMWDYPERQDWSPFLKYWWLDCFYPALLRVCISRCFFLSLSVCLFLSLPQAGLFIFLLSFTRVCTRGKRKVQGVPQSQTTALPRPQKEEKIDKSKQAQTKQTYESTKISSLFPKRGNRNTK